MPNGLRDLAAYGVGYTAQACAYALLLTDRYPNSDPERARPGLEPAAAPGHARARRRRPPLAADGRVPAAARAPAPRLAGALEHRGAPGRDRELVRRPRPRPLGRAAAPLPRRVRPLLGPRDGVPVRSSPTRSPASPARPATPSTSRSRRPSGRAGGSRSSATFLALPAFLLSGALAGALSRRPSSAGSPRSPPAGCRRACATSARCRSATRRRRTRTGSSSHDRYPYASPALRPRRARRRARARAGRRQSAEPPRGAAWRSPRSCSPALWAAAAMSLWQSRVPDGLALAERRPHRAHRPGGARPRRALRDASSGSSSSSPSSC